MPKRLLLDNVWLFSLYALGFWLVLGTVFLSQTYFYSQSVGASMNWGQQIPYRMSSYAAWGLLSWGVARLCLWLSQIPRTRVRVLWHGAIALLVAAVHKGVALVLEVYCKQLMDVTVAPWPQLLQQRSNVLLGGMLDGVLIYLMMVLLFNAYRTWHAAKQQQAMLLQMQKNLAQTQLKALQAQLQPHFLFNTLNGIVTLIASAPDKAETMVLRLARILRFSLDQVSATVPLETELKVLEDYLSIQKLRFAERLVYQIDVANECLTLPIPTLILQPLVENAVEHGIAPFREPGFIQIHARIDNQCLHIAIADSGPGVIRQDGKGIGLTNTLQRLETVYQGQAQLIFGETGKGESQARGGGLITLLLPMHTPTPDVIADTTSLSSPSPANAMAIENPVDKGKSSGL